MIVVLCISYTDMDCKQMSDSDKPWSLTWWPC